MTRAIKTLTLCVSALLVSISAMSADFEKEIGGRQSYMGVLGYNMGILGGMAGGKVAYDADLAGAAAKNMALAAAMNNSTMWPQGSDMDSIEGTVAKADLWQDFPQVMEYLNDMSASTESLASVAGNGLSSLQQGLGDVGDSCKGCHKKFRAKKK